MRFIDTNVFLRLITDDDPQQASHCQQFFKRCLENEEGLFTSQLVIAEIVWVLESVYGTPKEEIRDIIGKILNTPNMMIDNRDVIEEAINIYWLKNIDYVDAYNSILIKKQKIKTIVSYDKDFDRLPWIKRIEP
jgi:predicted nucleic-acid-binding protein